MQTHQFMQCGFHLLERFAEMLHLESESALDQYPMVEELARDLPCPCDLDENALHPSSDHFTEKFCLVSLPEVRNGCQS